MSNLPLNTKANKVWYGDNDVRVEEETTKLLIGIETGDDKVLEDCKIAEAILDLFVKNQRGEELNQHPKTNQKRPPEKRFWRHRNYYVFHLNQFRHWWKTSRLLVRLSGGYGFCMVPVNWSKMGIFLVEQRKQAKKAFKSMKAIGRGGNSRYFLRHVKPFTRSIRIILAVARGLEARRDERLYEVGIAEAFAFMGNRCSRWVARYLVDHTTKSYAFPFSIKYIEMYLDGNSRIVIVTMGFVRAILPFIFSFNGSAIGRKLTFNTYKFANYRWDPVQSLSKFHPSSGVYQDTVLDPELLSIAREVAVKIGHGADPVETRESLAKIRLKVVGAGHGGYVVYRRQEMDSPEVVFVHVTPYGPSILGEMPRYIVLQRKKLYYREKNHLELADATILDASIVPEASIYGYTYSGAFFKNQEWAALTTCFNETLRDNNTACLRLKTKAYLKDKNPINGPPNDLLTLKEFIRSGHLPKKVRKDAKRFKEISNQIKSMSQLVLKHQKLQDAPKQIILYLEGLDCSAKSSTGGLICKALEDCGYAVRTAQHNRPPTPEQRKKPWMDRIRFEYPEDVYESGEQVPEYAALVWDRGPAGDFVYGNFAELNMAEKMIKYQEFQAYDAICRDKGVLFCKLLFVADKDSIAATLGKRLAHKKIAQDLHTRLDANSIPHNEDSCCDGLKEIEDHIDPTDFVAFNKYHHNIEVFTEFARNTDNVPHHDGYQNPWVVVNTCKRHPARLQLLQTFQKHFIRFTTKSRKRNPIKDCFLRFCKLNSADVIPPTKNLEPPGKGLSIRAIIQSMILFAILCLYIYII